MDDTSLDSASTQLSRSQILAATARCLAASGYEATTIRRIAGELDCAVGSIYRYFKDKHELLSVVTQGVLEPVAVFVESGGTLEQTAAMYQHRIAETREQYSLMFWLASVGNGRELPAVVQRIIDGWTKHLGDSAAARRCWSVLHGSIIAGLDATQAVAAAAQGRPQVAELEPATRPTAAPSTPQLAIVITQKVPPSPRSRPEPVEAIEVDDPCML